MPNKSETTTLELTDDEIAVLVVHKLLDGKTPRAEGHDEARRKAIEVMDWLLAADLFSEEEAAGWKAMKATIQL